MTLEGLVDPEEGRGDLVRFDEVGGVYLVFICCLLVEVEAL